jgi:hypothetical protein
VPSVPDFTIPDLTLPDITLPDITLPDVTLPDFTIPDISIPGLDIPPATQQPTGLGDDAELDALAQDCFDGALIACDELYAISPVGSPYEAYGDTCAGRQDASTQQFCHAMAGFPGPGADSAPASLPSDDPGLIQLASRCWAGNMQACDDMAAQAPPGSEYESYGRSCAGRQDASATETCSDAFPDWVRLSTPGATSDELGQPGDPNGLGDDPELDALAQSCFGGGMSACDDLFWESPIDSDYETYGSTCGGRVTEELVGQCQVNYGGG